jgi:hypothetical protein
VRSWVVSLFFFISFHSHINCPQLGWRIKINRLLSDNHLHLSINVAPDSIWRWRRAKGHPIIDFHQTLSRKIGENQGDNGQTRVDRSRRRVLAIRPSPRRTVRVSPSLSPPPPPSSALDEREKGWSTPWPISFICRRRRSVSHLIKTRRRIRKHERRRRGLSPPSLLFIVAPRISDEREFNVAKQTHKKRTLKSANENK